MATSTATATLDNIHRVIESSEVLLAAQHDETIPDPHGSRTIDR
jgi:hypothetical protein